MVAAIPEMKMSRQFRDAVLQKRDPEYHQRSDH
jgi:hypothetical protein